MEHSYGSSTSPVYCPNVQETRTRHGLETARLKATEFCANQRTVAGRTGAGDAPTMRTIISEHHQDLAEDTA